MAPGLPAGDEPGHRIGIGPCWREQAYRLPQNELSFDRGAGSGSTGMNTSVS